MKFDIHKEPERFVKVLAGYVLMSNAELGLNTFIKRDGSSKTLDRSRNHYKQHPNFVFRAEKKRDEGAAPESGAMKRSKSDDGRVVAASPGPDVKEHEQDISNV